MTFDHAMSWLVPKGTFLYANTHIIGRICAPIICYLLVEGYHHTKNLRRYMLRLFVFAVVSHFPYTYLLNLSYVKATSIMWGLFLGLIALHVFKGRSPILLKVVLITGLCVLARPADWHYITILWMLGFAYFRGDFKKQMLAFVLIGLSFYVLPKLLIDGMYYYRVFIFLAIPCLHAYSGKQGKFSKRIQYLLYMYYPFHLIVLSGIKLFLNLT